MLSTSQVIVLEAKLWLPELLKLLVYMVRKVILRSHQMECQHTSRTPHTYCSGSNLVANVNSLHNFQQNKGEDELVLQLEQSMP